MNKVVPSEESYMLDPTVFTSREHVDVVIDSNRIFYLPSAFYDVIFRRWERFGAVMNDFFWPSGAALVESPLPKSYLERLNRRLKAYDLNRNIISGFEGAFGRLDVTPETKKILLEELSFLKEHSRLLLASRRTFTYLRGAGVTVVDLARGVNRSLYRVQQEKEAIFEKTKGTRWLVGILVQFPALAEYLKNDPALAYIISSIGWGLAIFDP